MAQGATTPRQHYYVPQPMYWPVLGSMSLFMMAIGAVFLFNGSRGGWISIVASAMLVVYMMFLWFGDFIAESVSG